MKIFPRIPAAVVAIVCASAVSISQAQIVANFTGGNGTTSVDQYQGIGGDGWIAGWSETTQTGLTLGATATNATPMPGGGNYLQINTSQSGEDGNQRNAAVGRQYESFGSVNTLLAHTITFDLRIDSWDITASNQGSKFIGAFGTVDRTSMPNNFLGDSTWMVRAYQGNIGNATTLTWAAYNGTRDGGVFTSANLLNIGSGMAVELGVTYSFTILNDPTTGSYSVSISNGMQTVSTASPLGYRTAKFDDSDYENTWITFQNQSRNVGDTSQFSVDNVVVIPEPSSIAFLGLAFCLVAFRVFIRRRQQASACS